MRKVKICLIGGGWVTENRHLPALHSNQNSDISVIVGRDNARIKELRKLFKIPEMIIGNAIDDNSWLNLCEAVVIGTEPTSHYTIVKHCLEHGKHVLVEKPFTTSPDHSNQLIQIARDKKLKLAVVHNFQYSDSSKALEKDIIGNKIGKIRSVEAVQLSNPKRRLPSWYEELPWGLFFDESPHLLYLLEKFAGKLTLKSVSAFRSREGKNTPALVNAAFLSEYDFPVSLHMDFSASVSEWFLLVNGEHRVGVLDIFRDIYFSLPNDGKHSPADILRTSQSAFVGHLAGVFSSGMKVLRRNYLCGNEEVMNVFLNSILTNSPLGNISGERGIRINKLQFEMMDKAMLF